MIACTGCPRTSIMVWTLLSRQIFEMGGSDNGCARGSGLLEVTSNK